MNISPESFAQLQQQCMLDARREYEVFIQQAQLEFSNAESIIQQLNVDKQQLSDFLRNQFKEAQQLKHQLTERDAEIASLRAENSGLHEEALDTAANLEDVIKTNDAAQCQITSLQKQVSELNVALKAKDDRAANLEDVTQVKDALLPENKRLNEEIYKLSEALKTRDVQATDMSNTYRVEYERLQKVVSELHRFSKEKDGQINNLLVKHNSVVHQCRDYEETLSRYHEHCQCQLKRETVVKGVNIVPSLPTGSLDARETKSHSLTAKSNGHLAQHSTSQDVIWCHHMDEEQLTMAENACRTVSLNASCKIKNCKSEDVFICLKCGVPRCIAHLSHDKEHVRMSTKLIWCNSCHCGTQLSTHTDQPPKATSPIKKSSKKSGVPEKKNSGQPYCYRSELDDIKHGRSRSNSCSRLPSDNTSLNTAGQQSSLRDTSNPIDQHLSNDASTAKRKYLPPGNASKHSPAAATRQPVTSSALTYQDSFSSTTTVATTTVALSKNLPSLSQPDVKSYSTSTAPHVPLIGGNQPAPTSSGKLRTPSQFSVGLTLVINKPRTGITGIPNTSNTGSTVVAPTTVVYAMQDRIYSGTPSAVSSSQSMSTRRQVDSDQYTSWPLHRRSRSLDYLYNPPPFKGLTNVGFTCFFNSALQGLSRIDRFDNLLKKLFKAGTSVLVKCKQNSARVTIPSGTDHGEVSKRFSETITDIRTAPKGHQMHYFNPEALLAAIRRRYKNSFPEYRQGDAHELMRCVLDAVRMEEIDKIKSGIKKMYAGVDESSGDVEEKLLYKSTLRAAHKVRTYIDEVVGGEMHSLVICKHCKHEAELIEPFLDISLPVPEETILHYPYYAASRMSSRNHTLEQCFKEFTSLDELDGDNKFICTNCSTEDEIQLRKASKQLKLQTLPAVLILHLKRFSIGVTVTKNSTFIKYPLELNVSHYCKQLPTDKKRSTNYSLFALVEHIGSLNFGHYTTFIKTSDAQWYKADDNSVTQVQESVALDKEAYLLFYRRI